MSKLVPVLFFSIMASAVVGMDYYFQRQRLDGQDLGLKAYVSMRLSDYKLSRAQASLATALPEKIDGWEIHPFAADDLKILTGAATTAKQAESFADAKGQQAFGMMVTTGVKRVDLALYKGETGIRLSGTHLAESGGLQTQALSMQNGFMKMLTDLESEGPRLFVTVQGVDVLELPPAPDGDAGLRQFRATLTDAITVTASTRSPDDAAIREAFAAVDFPQLNSLLATPLPQIDAQAAMILPAEQMEDAAPAHVQEVDAGSSTDAAKKPCIRKAGKLLCG
jgi:hypothetical protein